jgi:hypothetical protein
MADSGARMSEQLWPAPMQKCRSNYGRVRCKRSGSAEVQRSGNPLDHCKVFPDEFRCFVDIFQMSVNKYRSPAKSHRSEAGNPSEHSEYF